MAICNRDTKARPDTELERGTVGGEPRVRWWVICAASFSIQFVVFGQQNCSGIVYATLVDEYKATRGATAWVTSLAQSSSYAFGIVAAIICKRFGCRTTSMCAGIVCGVGLLLSSFASSIYILYFTYGILWGFGTCLLYFSSIIVLTIHCQERLALTSGIVAFGCAIGMLVQGPVIQALFQSLGWAQTLRILALVQVVIITLSGVAFGRQSTEYAQPGEGLKQTSVFDWSVFRNRQFQVWLIALVFFVFTYLIPHAHIIRFAEDIGTSKEQASFLVMYMAIGTTVSRPVIGRLADCRSCNRVNLLQVAFLLLGISTTLVTIATHYYWIAAYLFIFGAIEGCYVTIMPVITSDIVGRRNVSSAFGGLLFFLSVFMALGPPFAGWIFDVSQTYSLAFLIAGGSTVASVCVLFALSWRPLQGTQESSDSKSFLKQENCPDVKMNELETWSSKYAVRILDDDIITEKLTSV